jgi:hypothetical protein
VRRYENLIFIEGPPYIPRLTDECTATYICRLTNEYSGPYSSVPSIFLGFDTKEFISVIFLGIEEYKKPRNVYYFPVVVRMQNPDPVSLLSLI